jgi:predicted GH43/DUF377 family glycosyl hydrolase
MVTVKKHGIILEKRPLEFELEGVLNPAVLYENNTIHLFYRAVAKGNRSTIGYCRLDNPLKVVMRANEPLIKPEFDYESHGVEDPRIVNIEGLYYLSYCAYNGINALGALATSSDLKTFEKKGIIVPQVEGDQFRQWLKCSDSINAKYFSFNMGNNIIWDKNVIFFPKKIDGKFIFLHRIKPGIQIVSISNLEDLTEDFWKEYLTNLEDFIVLDPKFNHELSYIGSGCPPIETQHGWLLIYHGVHDTINGYCYTACAALLDLKNPQKEIARLPYPLFEPTAEWELKGYINNVCFPTGTVLIDDELYIYYGAADERIACASLCLSKLLQELLNNKIE